MNLTEQLVIMLTALSDFNSWNVNIALQTLQLFLQKQLPCSLAFSALLVIVLHVLVTCLAFWDLLSYICCSKTTLLASLRNLENLSLLPILGLWAGKQARKQPPVEQCVVLLSSSTGKAAGFFCRQLKKDSVKEVKFCVCLYTVYLELLNLLFFFVFNIHRTNEMLV